MVLMKYRSIIVLFSASIALLSYMVQVNAVIDPSAVSTLCQIMVAPCHSEMKKSMLCAFRRNLLGYLIYDQTRIRLKIIQYFFTSSF